MRLLILLFSCWAGLAYDSVARAGNWKNRTVVYAGVQVVCRDRNQKP